MAPSARTKISIATLIGACASAACGVALPPANDDAPLRPTDDRTDGRDTSTSATSPNGLGTPGEPTTPGAPAGTRIYRVFVSSAVFMSNELGGVTGADAQCKKLADDGLFVPAGRRWIAWLSDGTTSARERLGSTPGPWLLPNDVLVANDVAHLVGAAPLAAPIAVNEDGLFEGGIVWTGTLPSGAGDDKTCDGWATQNGHGRIGAIVAAKPDWTSRTDVECDGSDWKAKAGSLGVSAGWPDEKPTLHIYCFEVD